MEAKVTWNHGMTFIGTADSGFKVNLGTDPSVGGEDDGFRPLELMAISLAGCTAMDVISILKKKKQDVSGFEVTVEANRATDHPKVFTSAVIIYRVFGRAVDEAAVVRSIELSTTTYCPAQAMLARVFPIELKYEIYEDSESGSPELVVSGTWKPSELPVS